jgi:hypothetical protein
MRVDDVVSLFLDNLAAEICALRRAGQFTDEWLLDGKWNQGSWLHGRIWGAMVRAVPRPFIPSVENRLWLGKNDGDSFKPDLTVFDPWAADKIKLMVELESTNSSDLRVEWRDIERLSGLALSTARERPEGALIVTMLPTKPVKNWPQFDGLGKDKVLKRNANPYEFHKEGYLKALASAWDKQLPFSVVWANIDTDTIRVDFWDGKYDRSPSWPTKHSAT